MTKRLSLLAAFTLLFSSAIAQQPKNVQKLSDGSNSLTESLAVPSGKTLSGAGTFDLHLGNVTLPGALGNIGVTNGAALDALGGVGTNGLLQRTAANTYSTATIGTASGITWSAGTLSLAAIPNASLGNSSITIAGHSVALGGTQTLAAADLTNGTTGSGSVVLATAPTLSTPILGNATAASITGPSATNLVLNGGSSGASLTLGQGVNGDATLTPKGSGGITAAGNLTVSGTTASTSTTTGSAIFGGGIGVAGAANFGGNITVNGFDIKIGAAGSAGVITADGSLNTVISAAAGKSISLSGVATNVSGNLTVSGTTDATSGGTGALVVSGGVYVAKRIVAGNVVVFPSFTVASLPSASVGIGATAYATDLTSTTSGGTATGGGSGKHLVTSDGTNWIVQ